MVTEEKIPHTLAYKDAMWRHLAEYKVTVLGIIENGIWRKNRRQYAHILPFEHQRLNILEPYREEFWEYFESADIRLHADFHHLSSSQAMCFNLFFPFLADSHRHLQLLRWLFAGDGTIRSAGFEVVINTSEGTNFDFYFQTVESKKLFELKLTESAFGAAPRNDSHLQKYENVYAPALDGKFSAEFCSCDMFLQHYQLMRNVWNLDAGTKDSLTLIVPRANQRLRDEIALAESCLSKQYSNRVTVCYLEDIIAKVEQVLPCGDPRLKEHFRQFRQKYLPNMGVSVK